MTRVFDSELGEDRFSRLRLISWWDQEKIANVGCWWLEQELWATKF